MTKKQLNSYVQFAELIRANVSGSLKYKLIQKAQARLIDRLKDAGALTEEEADDLLV